MTYIDRLYPFRCLDGEWRMDLPWRTLQLFWDSRERMSIIVGQSSPTLNKETLDKMQENIELYYRVLFCNDFTVAANHVFGPAADRIVFPGTSKMPWYPKRDVLWGDQNYTVYNLLAFRVYFLSRVNALLQNQRNAAALYQCEQHEFDTMSYHMQLWTDMHFPLLNAIDAFQVYSNTELTEKTHRFLNNKSVYFYYEPCLSTIFHSGLLSDHMAAVAACDNWNLHKKSDNAYESKYTKKINKFRSDKCKGRDLARIEIKESLDDERPLKETMLQVLCSVLGNYRHAKFRPGYEVRRRVFAHPLLNEVFGIPVLCSAPEEFRMWIGEYDGASVQADSARQRNKNPRCIRQDFLRFVAKEYLAEHLAFMPTLERVLEERNDWATVRDLIYKGMDAARETIHKNGISRYDDLFANTRVQLQKVHVQILKYNKQNNHTPFEKRVYEAFVSINKTRFRNAYEKMHQACMRAHTMNQQEEVARLTTAMISVPHYNSLEVLTRENEDAIVELFALAEWNHLPNPSWLHYVYNDTGTGEDIEYTVLEPALSTMQDFADLGCTDKKLHAFLRGLPRLTYEALFAFYREAYKKSSVKLYQLPEHYYETYRETTRAKFLPPESGTLYYCENCCSLLRSIVKPIQNDPEITSVGMNKMFVTLTPDDEILLYCRGGADRNKSRKTASNKRNNKMPQNPRDILTMTDKTRKKFYSKMATDITKRMDNDLCTAHVAKKIDITGNMFKFYDQMILQCPKCGLITEFDLRKHENGQFTCTHCSRESLYITVSCFCQKKTRTIKENPQHRVKCTWYSYWIYEDRRGREEGLKEIFFCHSCWRRWIHNNAKGRGYFTTTDIVRGMKQQRKRRKRITY